RHGQIVDAVDLADIEDRADVGVLDAGRRSRLAVETLQLLRIEDGIEVRDLESHAPPELDVLGQVDGPHAALAEFVEDAVASELLGQDRIGRHGTQDSAKAGNSVREILFTYTESVPQRKP